MRCPAHSPVGKETPGGKEQADGKETSAPPSADAVAGYIASLPPDQFPNLTAVAGHCTDDDPDQRFELLIDLFVDGLAQRAALTSG